ncbi:hypothetical protein Dimus_028030 [Dionaea muscipula]
MATKLISFFLGLTIITCIFLPPPTNGTSRGFPDLRHHNKKTQTTGFSTELKHVDSGKNYLTKFERLQRAIERGNRRAKRIEAVILQGSTVASSSSQGVQAPVSPGEGVYLMNLSIGTPPLQYQAIMDTGSDLIWTQCEPCTQCFNQSTPIYDPQGSSSFSQLSCSSQLCQDLAQQTYCSTNSNGTTFCDYFYVYGDSSKTSGYLADETFTFGSDRSVPVPNIGFGCGTQNQGSIQHGAGLVGMGNGPVSLPSQLGVNQFSYYLPGMDSTTQTGTLGLGSGANGTTTSSTVTTPLIKNSLTPTFYYINPTGISVAGEQLSIPASTFAMNGNGTGGMIIDSGTTLTYLAQNAYDLVKEAMISSTNLSTVNSSSSTGLDLCFQLPQNTSDVPLPTMVFHFQGGDLRLPTENYFIPASAQVICLAMGPMAEMSIYGNLFQQNTLVLYDTESWVLSLTPDY